MLSSSLTTKGQVTIPREIRQQLHLNPGDKVGFVIVHDQILLVPKHNDVTAAFGIYQAKHHVSLEDMEKAVRNRGASDSD